MIRARVLGGIFTRIWRGRRSRSMNVCEREVGLAATLRRLCFCGHGEIGGIGV